MKNVPGAPLPPEPSLSLLEISLVCVAFGVLCIVAGIICLLIAKRGKEK